MDDFAELRKSLKLTQSEVAVMLGVSRTTYIKYELHPDTIPLGKYKKLVKILNKFKEIQANVDAN